MSADFERQLEAERERADYAWRNTRTIEAARQEEMRKRDEVEFELHTLRILAQASLDAREAEAKANLTWDNALNNYSQSTKEARAAERAMLAANAADKALRDALKPPNC
jgi:hypothetical protein